MQKVQHKAYRLDTLDSLITKEFFVNKRNLQKMKILLTMKNKHKKITGKRNLSCVFF